MGEVDVVRSGIMGIGMGDIAADGLGLRTMSDASVCLANTGETGETGGVGYTEPPTGRPFASVGPSSATGVITVIGVSSSSSSAPLYHGNE